MDEAGKGKALMPKVTFPVPHSGPAPMPDWPVHSAPGPAAGPSESLSLCEWGDPESHGKWWVGPGKHLPAWGGFRAPKPHWPTQQPSLGFQTHPMFSWGTPCSNRCAPLPCIQRSPCHFLALFLDQIPASASLGAGDEYSRYPGHPRTA